MIILWTLFLTLTALQNVQNGNMERFLLTDSIWDDTIKLARKNHFIFLAHSFKKEPMRYVNVGWCQMNQPDWSYLSTFALLFSTAHPSLKINLLMQTVKECRSPIKSASFDTFKAKISLLFTSKSTSEFS